MPRATSKTGVSAVSTKFKSPDMVGEEFLGSDLILASSPTLSTSATSGDRSARCAGRFGRLGLEQLLRAERCGAFDRPLLAGQGRPAALVDEVVPFPSLRPLQRGEADGGV